jgi:hypothetical protein
VSAIRDTRTEIFRTVPAIRDTRVCLVVLVYCQARATPNGRLRPNAATTNWSPHVHTVSRGTCRKILVGVAIYRRSLRTFTSFCGPRFLKSEATLLSGIDEKKVGERSTLSRSPLSHNPCYPYLVRLSCGCDPEQLKY